VQSVSVTTVRVLAVGLRSRREVGADPQRLADYCSCVLGWVSDYGTESEIPQAPDFSMAEYLKDLPGENISLQVASAALDRLRPFYKSWLPS
jgi:hypothetical protein